ncbi:HAD family hydrolase [Rhodanobacter sp. FW510-R12]|uniref:HAD family hydrolase n=1 Tax=unclassified Rhodanobacter TaxID=2621553 RepID=UPI0007A99BA6|nr:MULTISPECIES: HAD family hydrolase [unclassified Rhodanobacter]KZC15497.1 HAD family hydrolase [Rhodanobacter sp. FW104-R8]KZC25995.1 HAD family hydrolase [Rhodanobacter sp. FW510-T8]KZC29724.1 HAD family hydrolase [Rhodanobacter sp. FW510-R10]
MPIRALTLDLDDTLWPVLPALERADQAVDAWLRQHHPEVARAWPIAAMRELRMQVAAARLDLAHDFTRQRQLTLQQAFAACGVDDAPVQALWEIYFAARNRVELYPDSLPALERIAARWPLASLTNGNADLERIGIHAHFAHHVCARDSGVAKPDPRIFLAAAARLGVAPRQVLHVGDDPAIDIAGARDAGLRTAWINRDGRPWPDELGPPPELDLRDLTELADWLDAHGAR